MRYQQVCLGRVDGTANSVERTFTLYMMLTHVFYAECSQQVFNSTVYGQVGKIVVKVVESTQCRQRRAVAAATVAYFVAVVVEPTTE